MPRPRRSCDLFPHHARIEVRQARRVRNVLPMRPANDPFRPVWHAPLPKRGNAFPPMLQKYRFSLCRSQSLLLDFDVLPGRRVLKFTTLRKRFMRSSDTNRNLARYVRRERMNGGLRTMKRFGKIALGAIMSVGAAVVTVGATAPADAHVAIGIGIGAPGYYGNPCAHPRFRYYHPARCGWHNYHRAGWYGGHYWHHRDYDRWHHHGWRHDRWHDGDSWRR